MPTIYVELDDYIGEFTDKELERELVKRQKISPASQETAAARDELRRELREAFVSHDRRHFEVLLLRIGP